MANELKLGTIKPVNANQVVVESKYVKGGYVVVASTTERDALKAIVDGSLCYCQADDKFYQYDGSSWKEAAFSSASAGITVNERSATNVYGPTTYTQPGHIVVSLTANDGQTDYNSAQFVIPRGISVNGAAEGATNKLYYRPIMVDKDGESVNDDLGDLTIYAPTEAGTEGQVIFADESGNPVWGNIDTSDIDNHIKNTENPHAVTKAQVGLGNVTNVATTSEITANSNQNITSGAVFTALAGKANTTHNHDTVYSKLGHTHAGHNGEASGTDKKVWTYTGDGKYAWTSGYVDDGDLT